MNYAYRTAPVGMPRDWCTDPEKDPYRKAYKEAIKKDENTAKRFRETLIRIHEGGKKSNG